MCACSFGSGEPSEVLRACAPGVARTNPGRGSLRPPAASRCCARKLAARSFPRRPPAAWSGRTPATAWTSGSAALRALQGGAPSGCAGGDGEVSAAARTARAHGGCDRRLALRGIDVRQRQHRRDARPGGRQPTPDTQRGVAAGRSAQRACERSSDWRRGAAGSPDRMS